MNAEEPQVRIPIDGERKAGNEFRHHSEPTAARCWIRVGGTFVREI